MTQPSLFVVTRRAVFSDCGTYRYALWREWAQNPVRRCLFVMLNPSTADSEQDDPTIRRCVAFAKAWGADALDVANLYAFRATKPKDMKAASDPVGPDNDAWIERRVRRAGQVVLAWGQNAEPQRAANVVRSIRALNVPMYCLGTTDAGEPRHPLFIPADTELQEYRR